MLNNIYATLFFKINLILFKCFKHKNTFSNILHGDIRLVLKFIIQVNYLYIHLIIYKLTVLTYNFCEIVPVKTVINMLTFTHEEK